MCFVDAGREESRASFLKVMQDLQNESWGSVMRLLLEAARIGHREGSQLDIVDMVNGEFEAAAGLDGG